MRAPSGTCAAPTCNEKTPTAPQGLGHRAWDEEEKALPARNAVGLALQHDGGGDGRYDPTAGATPLEPALAAGAPSFIDGIRGIIKCIRTWRFDKAVEWTLYEFHVALTTAVRKAFPSTVIPDVGVEFDDDGRPIDDARRPLRLQYGPGTGTRKVVEADGTETVFNHGDVQHTEPTGAVVYSHLSTICGAVELELGLRVDISEPDGTQIYYFPGGQIERHRTDGFEEVHFADGTFEIFSPSGDVEELPPLQMPPSPPTAAMVAAAAPAPATNASVGPAQRPPADSAVDAAPAGHTPRAEHVFVKKGKYYTLRPAATADAPGYTPAATLRTIVDERGTAVEPGGVLRATGRSGAAVGRDVALTGRRNTLLAPGGARVGFIAAGRDDTYTCASFQRRAGRATCTPTWARSAARSCSTARR